MNTVTAASLPSRSFWSVYYREPEYSFSSKWCLLFSFSILPRISSLDGAIAPVERRHQVGDSPADLLVRRRDSHQQPRERPPADLRRKAGFIGHLEKAH